MADGIARRAEFQTPRFLPWLLILFAGSGCSALIYEIVWYQLLQFVIGSTAVSLGILLATFMGGLFLGSIVLPRFSGIRRLHPLRVYAVIEMSIGLCGILVLFGMPLVTRIYVTVLGHGFPSILLRAVISSVCLLVPTVLMGASLPVIGRWIHTTPQRASWLGLIYGANIAGSVFGCLAAGFYLLRIYDMATATFVAAAINTAVALIGFGFSMRVPWQTGMGGVPQVGPAAASHVWRVYAAVALSGACALGAEVVWTRLLGLMLGATVYTFSIVLAVFLLGLAIGSGAGSLASLVVRPQVAIGYCQLLVTAGVTWAAFMLANSLPYWPINSKLSTNSWFTFQLDFLRVVWVVLPATLLWGATFPLALSAVASDEDPAQSIGTIYAANTGGAIVGALTFSTLLIPRFGTRQAERLLIVLSAVSALCVLMPVVWSWRARVSAFWLAASMVVAALLVAIVPAVPPVVIAYGHLAILANAANVLYVGEGMNSSIAVSQYGNALLFHVSGKAEASTNPDDMRLQRMLGLMPALFHPKPRSVLVVGFGAGVTAGSFVVNPDVQRIVVCEIEPLVPPATSRYFGEQNYDVLHDQRTEMVYEDARNYMLTTPERFDIVTSDPIHPWIKGGAALYTREYFELVKEHLNPGGIVAQWVPLYETDTDTVRSEIATFFDIFPNGTIWGNETGGQGYDLMLLGQVAPARINVDELQQRIDRPEYTRMAKSLGDVGFNSASDILTTYAGQASDLKPWLEGAAINRDGNLRLQYLAGLAANTSRQGFIYEQILHYRRFPVNLFAGSSQVVQALRVQKTW